MRARIRRKTLRVNWTHTLSFSGLSFSYFSSLNSGNQPFRVVNKNMSDFFCTWEDRVFMRVSIAVCFNYSIIVIFSKCWNKKISCFWIQKFLFWNYIWLLFFKFLLKKSFVSISLNIKLIYWNVFFTKINMIKSKMGYMNLFQSIIRWQYPTWPLPRTQNSLEKIPFFPIKEKMDWQKNTQG